MKKGTNKANEVIQMKIQMKGEKTIKAPTSKLKVVTQRPPKIRTTEINLKEEGNRT